MTWLSFCGFVWGLLNIISSQKVEFIGLYGKNVYQANNPLTKNSSSPYKEIAYYMKESNVGPLGPTEMTPVVDLHYLSSKALE